MSANAPAPRVVALVPTWRASRFIEATLDALESQRYSNLEILISDDASPDDTAARCEAYVARDPRFRLIRQPRNLGWAGNVNALLRAARADYLLFAFQDDLIASDYIERCVALLEAKPSAVMAFPDIALVGQDGRRESKTYSRLDGVTDRLARGLWVARQRGSWWIPNRGVFRASAARAIGGLRHHGAGEFSADWPWLLHMSLLGEFVRIPEQLCTKIYQPSSLSRSWNFSMRAWSAVTFSAMASVREAPISISEKLALHASLTRFLSRHLWRTLRRWPGRASRRLGLQPPVHATAPSASPESAGRKTR